MNLIEQLGGYEKAKAEHEARKRSGIHACELERALLQHRREHGIYEMGDYIIFDDELMVFAMWSELSTDKAYIGYADAEDGIIADKSKFKHATDAEIKAKMRLEVG